MSKDTIEELRKQQLAIEQKIDSIRHEEIQQMAERYMGVVKEEAPKVKRRVVGFLKGLARSIAS
jgi:hypothetical protein